MWPGTVRKQGRKVGAENRGVVVTEAGSYSRLVDSCITHLKAQGPSRTIHESRQEGEEEEAGGSQPRKYFLPVLFVRRAAQ